MFRYVFSLRKTTVRFTPSPVVLRPNDTLPKTRYLELDSLQVPTFPVLSILSPYPGTSISSLVFGGNIQCHLLQTSDRLRFLDPG